MKPVGVAIVGCRRISDLHELGYRGLDTANILAVCDTRKGRAQQKAKDWGAPKVYTEYKKLLADPEIDLVELLVPRHLHAPMTVAACQAGKHVSVQKPMALTASETDQMIEAARTIDLPELVLFRDGKNTSIPLSGVEWHDSFIACTHHLIEVLQKGGSPRLDGPAGKAVLQFTLAA